MVELQKAAKASVVVIPIIGSTEDAENRDHRAGHASAAFQMANLGSLLQLGFAVDAAYRQFGRGSVSEPPRARRWLLVREGWDGLAWRRRGLEAQTQMASLRMPSIACILVRFSAGG